MIPARFAPVVVSLILSGLMSCIVTLVATIKNIGFSVEALSAWLGAWSLGWPIAFAVVLVASPMVRKQVQNWVRAPQN